MKNINSIILFYLISLSVLGQNERADTLMLQKKKNVQLKYRSLIIPTTLIGYGAVGVKNNRLKDINLEIKNAINNHIDKKSIIDNSLQYVPFLSVYILNTIGIKGENNLEDRIITLATAYIIMGITVNSTKKLTSIERPDGSSRMSFPSGHTATAFMGAEFLYQEYKDISIWYGISGYLAATGTGFLRISNNKHWFSDVVAGAGVGILSTKFAYWINPLIKRSVLKKKENMIGILTPFYNGKEYGLALSMSF
jgi:hypothetical protein